ncbi:MAG: HNH endonuclease [Burkholderiales bacterium]
MASTLRSATKRTVSKAIRDFNSGKRPFGNRQARTWFLESPDGGLVPLKYIFGMAARIAPVKFNTSEAISKAKTLGLRLVFTGEALTHDLAEVQADLTLDSTTKERLILARLGQGKFRSALVSESPHCFVTGYPVERLLVASHIVPWKSATNQERLDPLNGLLLVPQLDKAFDQGFITFDENGRIRLSSKLAKPATLGISPRMKLLNHANRQHYLKRHRDTVFKP